MTDFDPTPYQRIPQLNVARTIALATQLLARLPRDLPEDTRKAAKRLRSDLGALKAGHAARGAQPRPQTPDRRGADLAIDSAWAALHGRLLACSYLPADRHPQSQRAREVLAQLFPSGLSFLAYEYGAEWAESESKLQSIEAGGLAATLDELAGPAYLAEVRRAHTAYGDALGMRPGTAPPSRPAEVALAPLRDAVRKSIAAHARKLLALVDEDDAESIDRVTEALAPIVEARSKNSAGARDGEEDDTEEPVDADKTPADKPAGGGAQGGGK